METKDTTGNLTSLKLDKPLYVTQPSMPPLPEFIKYLEEIWESKWLTNNGQFHQQLEKELCDYLNVKYISLFSNGTLALVTALQALRITGEVITSPFSFVATTHALWWNNIKPVFTDIDPDNFNLDPKKIEAAITPKTTAILPVHVYGNPCNVVEIQQIADTYGLKVIYDACHTFGVTINEEPVLNFGDLSVMSFHATKVYNTFEGGAIVCRDEAMKKRIDLLKNFGFAGETTVIAPGINAKMNEVQSAFGLLQLKYVDELIAKRKEIAKKYREQLKNIHGIKVFNDIPGVKHCYSYFPVLIDKNKFGKSRDEVYTELRKHNIYTRRYFYPLISQFPAYRGLESALPGKMPVAEKITEEVLCLPIFPDLDSSTMGFVLEKINSLSNRV
ncbi:MAG: DegT/DnrJ/EryC1/StrS family aminotransferase [Bacteroidia bacterium]